jgi:hypothetical protein
MSNIIIELPFDYTALAPATADDLRDRAARLRGLMAKSTIDLIAIGENIIAIKAKLAPGLQFVTWVEKELPISIRLALGCMHFAIGHRENKVAVEFVAAARREAEGGDR